MCRVAASPYPAYFFYEIRIMFDTLSKAGKYLGQAAKMMIGVPDYDNYVEHMRVNHPDQTPMTWEEFFRERQDARYGGKGGAKCC